jgi:hypothetical protein
MAGVLPDRVRWRRGKRGTGEWYGRNLAARDGARIERLLDRRIEAAAAYVDVPRVEALYRRQMESPGLETATALWEPLILSEWLEGRHGDARSEETAWPNGSDTGDLPFPPPRD